MFWWWHHLICLNKLNNLKIVDLSNKIHIHFVNIENNCLNIDCKGQSELYVEIWFFFENKKTFWNRNSENELLILICCYFDLRQSIWEFIIFAPWKEANVCKFPKLEQTPIPPSSTQVWPVWRQEAQSELRYACCTGRGQVIFWLILEGAPMKILAVEFGAGVPPLIVPASQKLAADKFPYSTNWLRQ